MSASKTQGDLHQIGAGLRIGRHSEGEAVVVRLDGELDLSTAGGVRAELERAVEGARRDVVVDLRSLAFLDSTGIHALIEAHERCVQGGRSLVVLLAPGAVHRILDVSGMLEVLDHTTEEAVAA